MRAPYFYPDTLGHVTGTTVLIDVDAAGFGWFVDPTPCDDTEFSQQNGNWDRELRARPSSPAYGDMDLLTVVMHELGEVLGFQHLDSKNSHHLMSATLSTGIRHLPTAMP